MSDLVQQLEAKIRNQREEIARLKSEVAKRDTWLAQREALARNALCSECGGDGVRKIPGGITVCPKCNGRCWA